MEIAIVTKSSILDVLLGSKYISGFTEYYSEISEINSFRKNYLLKLKIKTEIPQKLEFLTPPADCFSIRSFFQHFPVDLFGFTEDNLKP